MWSSTCTFLGGGPHPPPPPARAPSDADDARDANDAVLGISLYHIPDSASSASFWFYFSRSIIVFVSSSSKLQASFHYKRDGSDDGDGVCGIG